MKTAPVKSAINGILLLNKSQGITSNGALQKAKRLYHAQKAGHTGSLDPLATGMLPVCFGEATKICQYLLDADKCYQTTGVLGLKTNTSDSTGEIIARAEHVNVSLAQLEQVLSRYTGVQKQIPSMFSALKHNGTPLYRFARAGIDIERAERDIIIKTLQLDDFSEQNVSLTVVCSKGTYIRNLVEDIGDALDVGAHVTRLHRVYTAGFEDLPMYTLEQLNEMSLTEQLNCLIPMDRAVEYLTPVTLSDDEVLILRQGRILGSTVSSNEIDCVRLYDERNQFIGLGERQINGDLKAKRLLAF
jgi:tRNA pseudouridine55 synthase